MKSAKSSFDNNISPFDAGIKSLRATLPAVIFLLGILNFNAYS